MKTVFRGEIYMVDFGEQPGSEQSGYRPALIIQNDKGNKYSPTTIVATITTKNKGNMPTHCMIKRNEGGIKYDSTVMFEQIFTIDKTRLIRKVGQVTNEAFKRFDEAVKASLAIL